MTIWTIINFIFQSLSILKLLTFLRECPRLRKLCLMTLWLWVLSLCSDHGRDLLFLLAIRCSLNYSFETFESIVELRMAYFQLKYPGSRFFGLFRGLFIGELGIGRVALFGFFFSVPMNSFEEQFG